MWRTMFIVRPSRQQVLAAWPHWMRKNIWICWRKKPDPKKTASKPAEVKLQAGTFNHQVRLTPPDNFLPAFYQFIKDRAMNTRFHAASHLYVRARLTG